jgi:Mycothiol maleylpyruvate isomerase N-terminal domain
MTASPGETTAAAEATSAAAYASAARAFSGLVDRVEPDLWESPGLGVWDVRALVGHTSRALVTVLDYLQRPAEVEQVTSPADYYLRAGKVVAADPDAVVRRGREAGAALGVDPPATVRRLVDDALAAVGDRLPEDPVVETLVGGMRLSRYLTTRTFELAVHSQDLARAAGLVHRTSDGELAESLELAVQIARLKGDGDTVLAALTGRQWLPAAFSVVV